MKFDVPQFKKGSRPGARFDPLQIDPEIKQDGLVYRWCANDAQNLRKKIARGYVFANGENGTALHGEFATTGIGSTPQAREMVLMATTEEHSKAYQEDCVERSEMAMRSLKREAQGDAPTDPTTGKPARFRNKIVIE